LQSYCGLKSQDVEKIHIFAFLEKQPLMGKFSKFCSNRIAVLYSHFAKFSGREIGNIVRCLPDKKQNFAWLSSFRYCMDSAQNLPMPAPENVLRVLQISSKSVHFRQSYIRTREHHQIAVESESSIHQKPTFEPNI